MPIAPDLPPVASVTDVVNNVAETTVGRPPVLDTANDLVDDAEARACLRLELDDEVALALRVDVRA